MDDSAFFFWVQPAPAALQPRWVLSWKSPTCAATRSGCKASLTRGLWLGPMSLIPSFVWQCLAHWHFWSPKWLSEIFRNAGILTFFFWASAFVKPISVDVSPSTVAGPGEAPKSCRACGSTFALTARSSNSLVLGSL